MSGGTLADADGGSTGASREAGPPTGFALEGKAATRSFVGAVRAKP